jgi:hypothetical protein
VPFVGLFPARNGPPRQGATDDYPVNGAVLMVLCVADDEGAAGGLDDVGGDDDHLYCAGALRARFGLRGEQDDRDRAVGLLRVVVVEGEDLHHLGPEGLALG